SFLLSMPLLVTALSKPSGRCAKATAWQKLRATTTSLFERLSVTWDLRLSRTVPADAFAQRRATEWCATSSFQAPVVRSKKLSEDRRRPAKQRSTKRRSIGCFEETATPWLRGTEGRLRESSS